MERAEDEEAPMVALHVRSIFRDYLPAYRLKTRQNTREVPEHAPRMLPSSDCGSFLLRYEVRGQIGHCMLRASTVIGRLPRRLCAKESSTCTCQSPGARQGTTCTLGYYKKAVRKLHAG